MNIVYLYIIISFIILMYFTIEMKERIAKLEVKTAILIEERGEKN